MACHKEAGSRDRALKKGRQNMTEVYLKKSDVIGALNSAADTADQYGQLAVEQTIDFMIRAVEKLPEADVEEVIRCGRCRSFDGTECDALPGIPMRPEDTCGYGEKRP